MIVRAGTAWMKVGMFGDGFPLGVFADLESAIKKRFDQLSLSDLQSLLL